MKHILHSIIFILSIFSGKLSIAQTPPALYVDSLGTVFISPNTPLNFHIGTSPLGDDAQIIPRPNGNPTAPKGHGEHHFTYYDPTLKQNILFKIFVDALPPATTLTLSDKQIIDKNNTIYTAQAVTFSLTSKDDGSGIKRILYAINGETYKEYNQPLTFKDEGSYDVKFYATDQVGNREEVKTKTIIIDKTPPHTTLEYLGSEHNGVVATSTRIQLTPSDAYKVEETIYSINGETPTVYRGPITLSRLTEGEHSISWQSVDMAGNKESIQRVNFFVDKTSPMVFEELIGDTYMVGKNEYSSGRSQLRITAIDNKAGVKEIYYSVNDEPYQLYEKPIFLSEIRGALSIKSYAIDHVGNRGESNISGSQFTMPRVDVTGPVINFSLEQPQLTLRDSLWIGPNTKISFRVHDAQSGLNRVEYKIDKNSSQPYTKPLTIGEHGAHTVHVSAWDNVENLNVRTLSLNVDSIAPEIYAFFSVQPHKHIMENQEKIAVYGKDVIVYLAATDDVSGVEKISYSINNSSERIYAYPLTKFKENITYTLLVKALDKLGNQSSIILKFRVE